DAADHGDDDERRAGEREPGHSSPATTRPPRMTQEQIAAERLLHGSERDEALSAATAPGLNERYTFSAFVQGNSHRFALAAAPARAILPLLTLRDSCHVTSHPLHAIWPYYLQIYSEHKVKYVSTVEFTIDCTNSVRHGRQNTFKQRYRESDILLVDDIQFLIG